MFNSLSPMHLLVVGIVALLLFGNRLPEIARGLGRSINEFKKGLREVGSTDDDESPEELDSPKDSKKPATDEKAD